jgi:hypothetical protein
VQAGLYASVYTNDSAHPVFDRNGEGSRLIEARSSSFKYGKFENGLVGRQWQNHQHLHLRDSDTEMEVKESRVYSRCLRSLLVLDLTAVDVGGSSAALLFEPFWNRTIERFLQDSMEEKQRRRSEWRHLRVIPDPVRLSRVLELAADRITSAAQVLGGIEG